MDFELNEEQEMIVKIVRSFVEMRNPVEGVSNLISCLSLDHWSKPILGLAAFCDWS